MQLRSLRSPYRYLLIDILLRFHSLEPILIYILESILIYILELILICISQRDTHIFRLIFITTLILLNSESSAAQGLSCTLTSLFAINYAPLVTSAIYQA